VCSSIRKVNFLNNSYQELKYTLKRKIIPYKPKLNEYARKLRNNSTKTEILIWQKLKRKQMYGYDFHRQKPIDNYILDFFCYELMLGIEINGYSHELIEVFENDSKNTKKIKQFGMAVLRFSDYHVLKEMENVLREIEQYIIDFEKIDKHTPNPSQEGNC